jgi:hypothetical protein
MEEKQNCCCGTWVEEKGFLLFRKCSIEGQLAFSLCSTYPTMKASIDYLTSTKTLRDK